MLEGLFDSVQLEKKRFSLTKRRKEDFQNFIGHRVARQLRKSETNSNSGRWLSLNRKQLFVNFNFINFISQEYLTCSVIMDQQINNDTKESAFYSDAADYWATVPATEDGMLGGLSKISDVDLKGSQRFLNTIYQVYIEIIIDCLYNGFKN